MFDREVTSIEEKDGRVIISFNDNSDSDSLMAVGSYLVGADGGKSTVDVANTMDSHHCP